MAEPTSFSLPEQVAARCHPWNIQTLLINQTERLLDPVYAIAANADVSIDVQDEAQREALAQSSKRAARLLELGLNQLLVVAKILDGRFSTNLNVCSLHSITHQAILMARSHLGSDCKLQLLPRVDQHDVIVRGDERILAVTLTSMLQLLIDHRMSGDAQLTLHCRQTNGNVVASWVASIEHCDHQPEWGRLLRLPAVGEGGAGRRVLNLVHLLSLATMLDAELNVREVPNSLQFSIKLPFVRRVPAMNLPSTGVAWVDGAIAIAGDGLESFTPITGQTIFIGADGELAGAIHQTAARLLVLHQTERRTREDVARSLEICRQVNVPVLLRASYLTYEDFTRYRAVLDAIVLEPTSTETLARYVIGLTRRNQRRSKRPADIH